MVKQLSFRLRSRRSRMALWIALVGVVIVYYYLSWSGGALHRSYRVLTADDAQTVARTPRSDIDSPRKNAWHARSMWVKYTREKWLAHLVRSRAPLLKRLSGASRIRQRWRALSLTCFTQANTEEPDEGRAVADGETQSGFDP
jgi:hypothetical protein